MVSMGRDAMDYCCSRGALHSLEKAYEIFSEQKDLYGFLMDFS